MTLMTWNNVNFSYHKEKEESELILNSSSRFPITIYKSHLQNAGKINVNHENLVEVS